jgi:hypothetical protein
MINYVKSHRLLTSCILSEILVTDMDVLQITAQTSQLVDITRTFSEFRSKSDSEVFLLVVASESTS